MPEKFKGVIVDVKQETPKVKLFRIKLDKSLKFTAGQNVVLSIPEFLNPQGLLIKRVYSIASSPASKILELCIAVHPAPSFSDKLSELPLGSLVNVEGPYGLFVYKDRPSENIIFIAAGTGIAPIISMIRWLIEINTKKKINLFFGFHSPENFIFKDELLSYAKENKIIIFPCVSEGNKFEKGRVTEVFPKHCIPDGDAYICGPPSMVRDTEIMLRKLNWSTDRIRKEQWE
jgi:NAD(P)H-flavin reductase